MPTEKVSAEDLALAPEMWDMQTAWDEPKHLGPDVETDTMKWLRKMRTEKPEEFRDKLLGMRKAYLQAKARLEESKAEQAKQARMEKESLARLQKNVPSEKWDGMGPCPGCGRGEATVVKESSTTALIGKVEAWMKKREEAM